MSGCKCEELGVKGCVECDKAAAIGAEVIGALEPSVSSLVVTAGLFHRLWTEASDKGEKRVSMSTEEAEAVAFVLDGVRERLEAARALL